MRAGKIGRTVGRTVAIALFGLTVTVAGIVGVQAAEPDEVVWDSVPGVGPATNGDGWGSVIERAATASEVVWD
jgi:hypothetical protein